MIEHTKMENITIIGSGNIGLSLAKGLVRSGQFLAQDITLTRRNVDALAELEAQGFQVYSDNVDAIRDKTMIVLAVLPQQLKHVLDELEPVLVASEQLIVSVVSGATCKDIRERLGPDARIVRAMPNTAIAIGESMTCIATDMASSGAADVQRVERMFESVGATMVINEELMTSATALCACGIAFFLRGIRAASQGGVEIGFHAHDALKMAIQTAKGAADLLLQTQSHPEGEIDKVTSPKGCTIAGLNEMEHHGFSSAFIKGIKLSARQADGLYEE